jgi:hypothetical protein
MATKFCMQCAGEFIDTVTICPDCDIELVGERPADHLEAAGDGSDADGQVQYELHEWAVESRVMLEQLLGSAGIRHAWSGTDLLVAAAVEARVDSLIDQVEVTTLPTLDPELPKLAYDIDDWSDEQQTVLMHALDEVAIAYEFDIDGALVVLEENEERVEAILDEIEFPDALPVDDGDATTDGDEGDGGDAGSDSVDGLEAADVMSDLFVAADRLRKNARDAEGVLTLVERADVAGRLRLPYGFSRAVWNDIVGQATTVKDLLESDEADDADIEEHAKVLRDTLRQYV